MIRMRFPFLGSFFTKTKRSLADQRNACRYKPIHDELTMGWWEDGQFHTVNCRILDISMGGLCLVSPVLPNGIPLVSLRLERTADGEPGAWVQCEVVRSRPLSKRADSPHKMQLRFSDCCTYDFFQTVTAGGAIEFRDVDVAPEFDPCDWR